MTGGRYDHKRITPEGKACGEKTARHVERAVAHLITEGEPDERCLSCAGRAGTVPNGCIQTQADFVKAVIEDVPFLCHAKKGKHICHAWFALRHAANMAGQKSVKVPWEFSPGDEK